MNIEDLFAQYSSKVAQIYLHQRAAKDLASKELTQLSEDAKRIKDIPVLKDVPSSLDSMYFYSARDRQPVLFAHKASSIQDCIVRSKKATVPF